VCTGHAALLALQAAAGNRATRDALAGTTAQRAGAFGPAVHGSGNAGGLLTLDGGVSLPVESATWSQTNKVAANYPGGARIPELHPTSIETGEIVITLAAGQGSGRDAALEGLAAERATLRLDRRSRDGALPATSIDLRDVQVAAVTRSKGDPPVVTIRLAVGGLSVAGLGKEAKEADAVGRLEVNGGTDWPPMPILEWTGGPGPRELPAGGTATSLRPAATSRAEPVKVRLKIAAGPSVKRLLDAMSSNRHLDLVFTPKGGRVVELFGVLVAKIESSGLGPDITDVELVAEQARYR
jgi:hypothetical protein